MNRRRLLQLAAAAPVAALVPAIAVPVMAEAAPVGIPIRIVDTLQVMELTLRVDLPRYWEIDARLFRVLRRVQKEIAAAKEPA